MIGKNCDNQMSPVTESLSINIFYWIEFCVSVCVCLCVYKCVCVCLCLCVCERERGRGILRWFDLLRRKVLTPSEVC